LEIGLDAVCLATEGVGLLEMLKEDSHLLECAAVLLGSSTRRIISWTAMIVPNNRELLAQ
jgi:hypothetical protein